MEGIVGVVHRYLGESLMTVALISVLLALLAKEPASGLRRASLIAGRVLVVLLSLQWLLGIINYFSLPAALRGSLVHPILMTAVVAFVHIFMGKVRKDPEFGRLKLVGLYAVTFAAIFVGIQIA